MFSDQLVPIRLPRVQKTMLYFHQEADGTLVEATEADAIDAATGDLKAGYLAKEAMEIVYPQASQAGITENTELAQGQFTGITVDRNTGLIAGTSADTGEIVIIGCVGVGLVTNPNGVTSMGDNYFKAGPGSGQLTVAILGGSAEAMNITQINKSLYRAPANPDGTPGTGTAPEIDGMRPRTADTKMLSSGLEMSKTDLAQEIANMILTQRGYQANTRIITVTDSMLEELVNMKR